MSAAGAAGENCGDAPPQRDPAGRANVERLYREVIEVVKKIDKAWEDDGGKRDPEWARKRSDKNKIRKRKPP